MRDEVERHGAEIDGCNQRGGRMLSIVDLIDAGTMDEAWAAYALAAIRGGASFMVGAVPGGAGKTTVMGALLNFVPADVALVTAEDSAVIEAGMAARDARRCYVCHEIGAGGYRAYLWDEALRRYFQLPRAGHMLATNLHADTCLQARRQVCDDNGVPPEAFRKMNLAFFLRVGRSGFRASPRVAEIWESDGAQDHRQVFGEGGGAPPAESSGLVSPGEFAAARGDIERVMASGARTTREVRSMLV